MVVVVLSIPLCDLPPVIRLSPICSGMIEYGSLACSAGITIGTLCIVHLHVHWFGWRVCVKQAVINHANSQTKLGGRAWI